MGSRLYGFPCFPYSVMSMAIVDFALEIVTSSDSCEMSRAPPATALPAVLRLETKQSDFIGFLEDKL
jgi:hypothetical protein